MVHISVHRQDVDIDRWKPVKDYAIDASIPLTTRFADFDPLGHVNNTMYFNYLETLVWRCQPEHRIGSLNIEFTREIDQEVQHIQTGLRKRDEGCDFKIFNDDKVFAAGDMVLTPKVG